MLIGLTQTFPNGIYYAQFKEGGTSLASPLLAGVVADADQAAGGRSGFLNPVALQGVHREPDGLQRHRGAGQPGLGRGDPGRLRQHRRRHDGYIVSLRVINYEGAETYCDGTDNCATRDVTLNTAPGFDSMTGLGSVGSKFIPTISKF